VAKKKKSAKKKAVKKNGLDKHLYPDGLMYAIVEDTHQGQKVGTILGCSEQEIVHEFQSLPVSTQDNSYIISLKVDRKFRPKMILEDV